jgi:hypothetical protein
MAEERALCQLGGQVRAVDDYQLAGRCPVFVDASGEKFLACARLSGDDDVGLAARCLAHDLKAAHDGGAFSDDGAALDLARPPALLFGGPVGNGPLQNEHDVVQGDGLAHIIPGSVGDGQGRAVRIPVAGQDDNLGQGGKGLELLDVRQSVAVGQVDVEKDQVAVHAAKLVKRIPDALRDLAGVSHAFDDPLKGTGKIMIVINYENVGHL